MSGIIDKVKDILHKDKDDTTSTTYSSHNTNDPLQKTTSAGYTGTTGHGTMNPADASGQHGATGGLTGHNTTSLGTTEVLTGHSTTGHNTAGMLSGHGIAKAVDRNNDGRVDARDLTGQHASGGLASHGTTCHGTTGAGLTGSMAQGGSFNPSGQYNTRAAEILDPHVGTGAHSHSGNTAGGIGHDTISGGLSGHSTTGHSTAGGLTGHGTANPVDRNNDGRVDARDLTGHGAGGHAVAGGLTGHQTTGGLGHTANPADSNNNGRVDARDLTGQGHSTAGGLTGHPPAGQHGHTANPIDRNNDGRMDARDLPGSTAGGHHGTNTTGGLDHRPGESGDLPRALVEDVSRAQPAGFTEGHTGSSTHGTTGHGSAMHDNTSHGKPSLKDKLNPKTDADRDGKAGIMD